jgi:receptor protein-tyrosine kinase
MTLDQILGILWRRRVLLFAALALFLAAVVALTLALPRTYKATATLSVAQNPSTDQAIAFDPNVAEQFARTYTTLAANPNVAEAVRARLPFAITRTSLMDRMSFAPVERTQLLEISSEARSPEQARLVANLYARTFTDRIRGQFERGQTQASVALNEAAVTPQKPAKPNVPLYIGIGAILASLLAAGLTLLRDRLDTRIPIDEIHETVFQHPILARIPPAPRRGTRRQQFEDAFRLLRTNLDFVPDERPRVVAVTSPSPVEGKSTIAGRLATVVAGDGENVLLIEGDLRRPGLAAVFGGTVPEGAPMGLAQYLAGVRPMEDIVIPDPELPGLDVIWAGAHPPSASALLQSVAVDALLASMRERYDRIIIDTPPISVGADASLLARRADGTLLVIDERKTRRTSAQAGLNQLEKARAKILGVVLNRATTRGFEQHSYGYYAPGAMPDVIALDPIGEPDSEARARPG